MTHFVYRGFERFWHWAQAALVMFLGVTGFEIHGSFTFFGFERAVRYHSAAATVFLVLIAFAIFWHLTTGEWRQYLPTWTHLRAQADYYVFGIFQNAPHPTRKTVLSKLNPLQRITYAGLCAIGAVGSAILFQITRDAGGGVPGALLLVLAVVMISYGINGVIGTITAEIFPTHLRSTGPGFCQNIGKGLGGLAGPPVAGALVTRHGYPLVLALPGLLLFALALLIWSLPRADGREVLPVEADDYLAS